MFEKGHKITHSKAFTESQIRYAMQNTKSNLAASRFLNVCEKTYKKYATQFIDIDSGKSLYELHKNKGGSGIKRECAPGTFDHGIPLLEILDGLHPEYPVNQLKKRLMKRQDIIPCTCFNCGMNERRITDEKMPLLLDFIDGNKKNHKKENLQWLCYNCMFLTGNWNPTGGRKPGYVYMG